MEESPSEIARYLYELHLSLNHMPKDRLIELITKGLVRGVKFHDRNKLARISFSCQSCRLQKATRMAYRGLAGTPLNGRVPLATHHMDAAGPVSLAGYFKCQDGIKWTLNIVDDASGYIHGRSLLQVRRKSLKRCWNG